ncbi:hypothetical protein K503DRAFT_537162 [Rhizopogon vinicolor AM-OR11-026]|uniref:Uncharacterized protein n=1 Tax=Rhizopogon vinicolor AM-OR11-026 TaxID=1314800 RepID=A0A1B7MKY7_9AGAM|nr:hypothetical protein K503DRAFT_537162 [Rhizopogon vinicolor AM-OR11-026]
MNSNMRQGWTVCCRECKGRYQISIFMEGNLYRRKTIKATNIDFNDSTGTAMPLITNFDVQEIIVRYLVFRAADTTLIVLWPCFSLRLCVISSFKLLTVSPPCPALRLMCVISSFELFRRR